LFAANSGDESHPVGLKKTNAWGLYEMLRNVREWVDDRAAYYDYIPLPDVSVDPKGPHADVAEVNYLHLLYAKQSNPATLRRSSRWAAFPDNPIVRSRTATAK
jgi:formylglycine-generating enzyme required for sulfatase activity